MACHELSRHAEDKISELSARADSLPWWRFMQRRRLQRRLEALFDLLIVAYRSEIGS